MKRVFYRCIAIILLVHIILLLCACNSDSIPDRVKNSDTADSSVEPDDSLHKTNYEEMDLKERSKTFVDLLLQSCDYAELSSNFPVTQDIASEIHAEQYEAINAQIAERFGGNVIINAMTEVPVSETPDIIGVIIECQGENGTFTLNLSFEDNMLCGFDTSPAVDFTVIENGIKIKTGSAEAQLPGVLLLPDNYEGNELVIIIPGSGPQDLNGTNVYLKPYRDLAQGLYDNNVAVYRFDKRTYYYKESIDPETLTPKTEVIDDVLDILSYFTSSKEYSFERIYLMGHSLGGYLLPKIYEEAKAIGLERNIAGMIFLAANASPIEDVIVEQYQRYISDFSYTDTSQEKAILNNMIEVRDRVKSLSEASNYTASQLAGLSVKYYLYLQNYDPVTTADSINIPMLFLFAGNDKNVSMAEKEKWQLGLSQKDNVEFAEFDDLNHMFTKGCGWLQFDCFSKNHVEDDVVNTICSWNYIKG